MGRKIAITGGIGAGKSSVSERLRSLGAAVLDADDASRAVVEKGTEGLKDIVSHFGKEMLLPDQTLHRKKMAERVFADPSARNVLNAILHPRIQLWLQEKENVFFQEHPHGLLFFEIPLLFEAGLHPQMDEVWLVTAHESVRLKRIMERDRCGLGAARQKMESQMPEEEKKKHAHVLIDNSGGLSALYQQVDTLYESRVRERSSGGTQNP